MKKIFFYILNISLMILFFLVNPINAQIYFNPSIGYGGGYGLYGPTSWRTPIADLLAGYGIFSYPTGSPYYSYNNYFGFSPYGYQQRYYPSYPYPGIPYGNDMVGYPQGFTLPLIFTFIILKNLKKFLTINTYLSKEREEDVKMKMNRFIAFLVIINMILLISMSNILFAFNEPIILDEEGNRIYPEIPGYGPLYLNLNGFNNGFYNPSRIVIYDNLPLEEQQLLGIPPNSDPYLHYGGYFIGPTYGYGGSQFLGLGWNQPYNYGWNQLSNYGGNQLYNYGPYSYGWNQSPGYGWNMPYNYRWNQLYNYGWQCKQLRYPIKGFEMKKKEGYPIQEGYYG